MATIATPQRETYTRTFSAFSGAHIVATFNGRHIAELQGITYSITREKGPIYTLGSPDPRGFGRGKRGIAGSLIFQTFDREALMEEIKKSYVGTRKMNQYQTFITNISKFRANFLGTDDYYGDEISTADVSDLLSRELVLNQAGIPVDYDSIVQWTEPEYNDQLLPFHISIAFANEEGRRARMEIFGVEILNEGQTMTVDDISLEKAMTFVARRIKYIRPMALAGRKSSSSLEFDPGIYLNPSSASVN